MQRSTKWIAAIVAVILVVGSVIATTSAYWGTDDTTTQENEQFEAKPLDTSSKKIVAEYKGGKVTEGELNTYINVNMFFNPRIGMAFAEPSSSATAEEKKAIQEQQKQDRQQFANQYLTKKYIASLQKTTPEQQKTIDKQTKEVEQQIVPFAVQSGNPNAKTLQDAIKGKGFTHSQLKAIVQQDAKVEMYLDAQIANMTYDHVKLRHVLVTFIPKGEQAQEGQPNRTEVQAKTRALEVKKKLESGGDWVKLTKEYSEDPGSKDKGGLYESDVSGFVEAFANAAKTLPIGKISDPIKTEYGFHVMKVEARSKKKVKDAPKDQLESIQSAKRQEVFEQLKEKAGIKLFI